MEINFKHQIIKIISGGQTGADQAGLYAAEELGIQTGGTMPKFFRTETGQCPDLAKRFHLQEHITTSYIDRTLQNILNSDMTLLFSNGKSTGSLATEKLCARFQKRIYRVFWENGVYKYSGQEEQLIHGFNLYLRHVKILNVAGNRESVNPGIFNACKDFLIQALKPE